MPQSAQKPRRTRLELWKRFGSPRVHSTPWPVTSGPKKAPNAFWHMRQWQIDGRPRRATRKRTAPHWQPPVKPAAVTILCLPRRPYGRVVVGMLMVRGSDPADELGRVLPPSSSPGSVGNVANQEIRLSMPYWMLRRDLLRLVERADRDGDARPRRHSGRSAACRSRGRSRARPGRSSGTPRASPRVTSNSAIGTPVSGAKNEPKAFWHMRQWQMCGSLGAPWNA